MNKVILCSEADKIEFVRNLVGDPNDDILRLWNPSPYTLTHDKTSGTAYKLKNGMRILVPDQWD